MSGKIPVRIVADGDGSGTLQRVGVDFGRNHNFEVVTAADARSGGHICMTQAVATALGISTTTYLLDGIGQAAADVVYSYRRVFSAYGGGASDYIITVRESSANNTADVLLDSNGYISLSSPVANLSGGSGATLGDFVGANSAYITRDYDHSGNGRHATQGTTANQKRLISAGVLEVRTGGSRGGANCAWTTVPTYTSIPSFSSPSAGEMSLICVAYGGANMATDNASPWVFNSFGGSGGSQHWQFSNQAYESLYGTTRPAGYSSAAWATSKLVAEYIQRSSNNLTGRMRTNAPLSADFGPFADGTYSNPPALARWGSGHNTIIFGGWTQELFQFNRVLTTVERDALQDDALATW